MCFVGLNLSPRHSPIINSSTRSGGSIDKQWSLPDSFEVEWLGGLEVIALKTDKYVVSSNLAAITVCQGSPLLEGTSEWRGKCPGDIVVFAAGSI